MTRRTSTFADAAVDFEARMQQEEALRYADADNHNVRLRDSERLQRRRSRGFPAAQNQSGP